MPFYSYSNDSPRTFEKSVKRRSLALLGRDATHNGAKRAWICRESRIDHSIIILPQWDPSSRSLRALLALLVNPIRKLSLDIARHSLGIPKLRDSWPLDSWFIDSIYFYQPNEINHHPSAVCMIFCWFLCCFRHMYKTSSFDVPDDVECSSLTISWSRTDDRFRFLPAPSGDAKAKSIAIQNFVPFSFSLDPSRHCSRSYPDACPTWSFIRSFSLLPLSLSEYLDISFWIHGMYLGT